MEFDADGDGCHEILYAKSAFRNKPRYSSVLFKGGYYGKLCLIFMVSYKGEMHELCLIQRLKTRMRSKYSKYRAAHKSGLEVLESTHNWSYHGRCVLPVKDIKRAVHIVPEYSRTTRSGNQHVFLVNHDSDRNSWARGKGVVEMMDTISSVT